MMLNETERELLVWILEDKIYEMERDLSLCEGLESERYIANIKININKLRNILNKIKEY